MPAWTQRLEKGTLPIPSDYTLDVDEAGRFSREDPWSSVVGWLRPGEPGDDEGPVRRALLAAFPQRWPLHAAEANAANDGDRLRAAVRAAVGGKGWLVCARMHSQPRGDLGLLVGEPYPWALRALFTRVLLMLRDQAVRVHVRVADRGVPVRVGAGMVRGYMHHTFVHTIGRSAAIDLPTAARLNVVSARFKMDATTPAGLIVADTFANQLGYRLRTGAAGTLVSLSRSLEDTLGVRVETVGRFGPLSSLAADGPLDQAIRDAARSREVPALGRASWAEHQAQDWVDEVRP